MREREKRREEQKGTLEGKLRFAAEAISVAVMGYMMWSPNRDGQRVKIRECD